MRTYLSENIIRHIGVIPDVPVHDNVVKDSNGELYRGYDDCADKAAPDKRNCTAAVYAVQNGKDRTAGKRHCPVRIAAADYLDKTI